MRRYMGAGPADNKGITLVELVVVMAVLSVLASVAMPMLRVSVKRAKEMELRRDLRQMRDAMDAYKRLVDEGRVTKVTDSGYPQSLDALVEGIDVAVQGNAQVIVVPQPGEAPPTGKLPPKLKLLRKIPVDPMTREAKWGLRGNEDEPDSAIWNGKDVYDVYSLSDGTALDGTKYKDW